MSSSFLLLLFTTLLIQLANAVPFPGPSCGVHFHNKYSMGMYISSDWAKVDEDTHKGLQPINEYVKSGESVFLPAPENTSPKYYIGPTPNNRTPEVGDNRNHHTAVEATFAGFDKFTYFDISIEKGFTVPVWCHGVKEPWETGQGCLNDVLSACPQGDRHIDGKTGIYDYCRGTLAAENVAMRSALCPGVYVRWDDTRTKTMFKGHVLSCTIRTPQSAPRQSLVPRELADDAADEWKGMMKSFWEMVVEPDDILD